MTQMLGRHEATAASVTEPLVEIEYFTDPLCCWSWAMEPQWRRVRFEFDGRVCWRYRMGGMIADWNSYQDPINSISRPSQMGPLWFQARELSGMPLEDRIWFEDPPRSSYPACAAVKAAELQSPLAAERYLRRLREAVMTERRNISRADVLLAVAEEVQNEGHVPFDADRFDRDRMSPEVRSAFREDLRTAGYLGIGRFPTLILRRQGEEGGLMLVGYRPYESIRAALRHVDAAAEPVRQASSRDEYETYWGGVLDRELQEVGCTLPVAF